MKPKWISRYRATGGQEEYAVVSAGPNKSCPKGIVDVSAGTDKFEGKVRNIDWFDMSP